MSKKKDALPKSRKAIQRAMEDIDPNWEPDDEKMDFDTADAIYGDLPDGAYFAIMEEMTGLDPADIATFEDDER